MKIKLKCEKEIAYDSPDHIKPLGTMQDNSTNPRFNKKFYKLLDKWKSQIKVLDLGCSGGGFIRECINDGCLAVGLEGSNYSQKFKREEWAVIPEFLFTCDIGKKFELFLDEKSLKFNLITSWEVFEHLKEKDIDSLVKNVKDNLEANGIFIGSISNFPSPNNGLELHQTQRPKEWWIKKFEEHGFYERKELYSYFNNQYVRGRKENLSTFHVIFSRENKEFKNIELSFKSKIKDLLVGSSLQKMLCYLVNGKVEMGY